jgi:hypothetical protein
MEMRLKSTFYVQNLSRMRPKVIKDVNVALALLRGQYVQISIHMETFFDSNLSEIYIIAF